MEPLKATEKRAKLGLRKVVWIGDCPDGCVGGWCAGLASVLYVCLMNLHEKI